MHDDITRTVEKYKSAITGRIQPGWLMMMMILLWLIVLSSALEQGKPTLTDA